MNKIIMIFCIVSFVNVVLSTAKSIFTVKGGILSATVINAITFGFYTYVIVLTANADFSTNMKALITIITNILGVALVKFVESKLTKDKLWVFNATCQVANKDIDTIMKSLKDMGIKLVYNELIENELYTMQIFSYTQKESLVIKSVLENYDIKYHAYETKTC